MEEKNGAQNQGTEGKEPEFKDIQILRRDNSQSQNPENDPLASFTNILMEDTKGPSETDSQESSPPPPPPMAPPPPPPPTGMPETDEEELIETNPEIYDETAEDLDALFVNKEEEEDILSPEFLQKQRKEWEKSAQAKMKGPKKKFVLLSVIAVIVLTLIALSVVFTLSLSQAPPPPPPKRPVVKKKVAPPPPPKAEEKKTAEADKKKEEGEKQKENAPEKPKTFKEISALLKTLADKNESEKFQQEYLKFLKAQGDDTKLQLKVQKFLLSKGKGLETHSVYKAWIKEKPDSALANYLYAISLDNDKLAKEHFDKSLKLDPKFYYTRFALADKYLKENDWKKAETEYTELIKIFPKDKKLHYQLAKIKTYQDKTQEAIDDYSKFLESQKESKKDIALALIDFAQLLPKQETAEKYLEEIKKDPKLYLKYRYYATKQKAIYKKLSLTDFKDWYPTDIREFHIIYLLSNGRNKKVKLLPTPPKDFPDFWKIFLGWKANTTDWKRNAFKLSKKYQNKKDKTKYIISRLWLERMTPEEAESKINEVSPESRALFYFVLAEHYRKNRKKKEAKEYYKKAYKQPGNIYKPLIKYYKDKL
jgi:Tfp pilus assembly protein PilF/flagellar basal body-associated protein FliL